MWTFENRIGAAAAQAIFEGVQQQLDAHGYLARCGQIVDATIVPAPRQHFTREEKALVEQDAMPVDWTPAKRCQKDLDARWTKKHGQSHHGYKLTVNVDVRHKFIRKIQTSTASEHDSRHLESVLDRANTSADVYADRGYPSEKHDALLKAGGYRNRIQRKGARNRPLSARQIQRNARIAQVRARVEHAFAGIAQMGGKLIRSIGQARADFAMTMMATCYNLKRFAHLQSVRNAAG